MYLNKFLFAVVIVVLTGARLLAQTHPACSGIIRDGKTNAPLAGARIVTADLQHGAMSDADGFFTVKVNAMPASVTVTYLGYDTLKTTLSEARGNTLLLTESAISTDEVLITANAAEERQRQSALSVEAFTISNIKETPAANFYEGLGHLKGVDITAASISFRIVNTRGFNSTSPVRSLQIIDGVDNQAPGLNFSLGNFLGASELDIEMVDLVVGASSAFYGPNAFNGVISMKTKDPFVHQGVAASIKTGERGLSEGSVRYAQAFKIKGEERLAFKLNAYYLQAHDWEADNYDPVYGTDSTRTLQLFPSDPSKGYTVSFREDQNNPGGYDAVNRYGDENLSGGRSLADDRQQFFTYLGFGTVHRPGYAETDLVDYNTQNVKLSGALHYKLTSKTVLIAASNFGYGTTVYQGDNRYSLRDIRFFQNRLEIRQDGRFFIRAYATNENAGNSYDAVFTAFQLQTLNKSDFDWSSQYRSEWTKYVNFAQSSSPVYSLANSDGRDMPNVFREVYLLDSTGQPIWDPATMDFKKISNLSNADTVGLAWNIYNQRQDSIAVWHQNIQQKLGQLDPSSEQFKSTFASITSKPLGRNGTRLIDRSALFHVHGEYKFHPTEHLDMVVGGNGRMYRPVSEGTIFEDTGSVRIVNMEGGVYGGLEGRVLDERLKLNLAARLDRNQNFNFVFSPAASAVYKLTASDVLRVSLSTALRNPTLADQYLSYNVGRAILRGNISGYDSVATVESFVYYLDTQRKDSIKYFTVDPIRPERATTAEIGWRSTLFKRLYVDAGYYFSYYQHFIGYQLGVIPTFGVVGLSSAQAYRFAVNSKSNVTTQGFSLGLNYYFENGLAVNGNYSWNRLNKLNADDPIIPAFNTPEHKFNLGFSGRDVSVGKVDHVGFNVNYKWVQGFMFEGSPQFTGLVPTYDMVDFQINKTFPDIFSVVKLGTSNLFGIMPLLNTEGSTGDKVNAMFNNKQFQVYGGPRIGRMIYLSLTTDVSAESLNKLFH